MKRFNFLILFSLVLLSTLSTTAQDDFKLIEPIIETAPMNFRQAQAYSSEPTFLNWGIKKTGLDSIMKSYNGEGVVICICDTGRPTHKKLSQSKMSANFTDDKSDKDGNGHSTHVSGIIHEIAPKSNLIFAKVLSDQGGGSSEGVANGIRWCVNSQAKIINMSLGSPVPNEEIKRAIDYATERGAIIIAAAGNEGKNEAEDNIGYPALYKDVVCVGSINQDSQVSIFSSSGEGGDVVAAGERILSTYGENTYRVLSGTSMAAPFVSGVAALFLQKNKTTDGMKNLLAEWSTDFEPIGYDRHNFYGHLDPIAFMDVEVKEPIEELPEQEMTGGNNQLILFIGVGVAIALGLLYFHSQGKFKSEQKKTYFNIGDEIWKWDYNEWVEIMVNESNIEEVNTDPVKYRWEKPE